MPYKEHLWGATYERAQLFWPSGLGRSGKRTNTWPMLFLLSLLPHGYQRSSSWVFIWRKRNVCEPCCLSSPQAPPLTQTLCTQLWRLLFLSSLHAYGKIRLMIFSQWIIFCSWDMMRVSHRSFFFLPYPEDIPLHTFLVDGGWDRAWQGAVSIDGRVSSFSLLTLHDTWFPRILAFYSTMLSTPFPFL